MPLFINLFKGAKSIQIECAEEALHLLKEGMDKRITAATNCNAVSSRGHAIFILSVSLPISHGRRKRSQFYLCDLAGSEKLKKTQAEG